MVIHSLTVMENNTSGQINLTQGRMATVDRWFNHVRQVASMCPPHWPHLANTIDLVLPSAHQSPQPKRQIDQFSRFTKLTGENPYNL